ncbi:MAG: nucleotidyltransferase domain-containing protein [Caldimicrobium sp.]|nr:nucleotidyltransferase domain-containing protein [Caldimicrobium sp.]MCX7873254.1 nucleotidyltransferase domain-containing protein [Caldimicrobium sp.]MDW8094683.1 nucleotidyltransferase domain-containing protein [Caldimicrobium sp.]
MKTPFYKELQRYKNQLTNLIKNYYGENLLSLALFGSSARGDLTISSDIDILVIVKSSSLKMRERIFSFYHSVGDSLNIRDKEFTLSPLILTLDELKQFTPFLLNLLHCVDILYDENNTLQNYLKKMQTLCQEGLIQMKELDNYSYWWYDYKRITD